MLKAQIYILKHLKTDNIGGGGWCRLLIGGGSLPPLGVYTNITARQVCQLYPGRDGTNDVTKRNDRDF